ncbi:transmembrane protein 138 [Egretta garzetta]|uniref:transmembrane protein 138 n=1 Tax=Egretta garzetta TaxID=188379 RepID=UPI00051F0618|nr:transmembrane protein 138 [Egretta garzetta]
MLQTSNYSLVLFLQFLLLFYDLFVNSFSELLRTAPAVQLVLFIIQDIAILFNVIIIFLMFFNTFVFQAGLVNLLFHKFKGTILLSAAYLALSISFHVWAQAGLWAQALRAAVAVPAGLLLPYPFTNLVLDVVLLFLYLGTEATRIFFGKATVCQRKVPLSTSLPLTVPAAVMAAYYLLLQTYALRLEAILSSLLLLFYATELLLGVLALVSFSRYSCLSTCGEPG